MGQPANHTQFFLNNVRRTIELIQLLKFQFEEFKTLEITKVLPKDKNLLQPNAILMGGLNAYLAKVKTAVGPEVFREMIETMTREQLGELSLLMDVGAEIGNLEEVIMALRLSVEESKQKDTNEKHTN